MMSLKIACSLYLLLIFFCNHRDFCYCLFYLLRKYILSEDLLSSTFSSFTCYFIIVVIILYNLFILLSSSAYMLLGLYTLPFFNIQIVFITVIWSTFTCCMNINIYPISQYFFFYLLSSIYPYLFLCFVNSFLQCSIYSLWLIIFRISDYFFNFFLHNL